MHEAMPQKAMMSSHCHVWAIMMNMKRICITYVVEYISAAE